MGYVAVKGGGKAIAEADLQLDILRTRGALAGELPLDMGQIQHQMHFLHSQVLSEGGLYDEELAALALKQSLGDSLEAAFYLRAFKATRPRIGETPILDTSKMRLIRRISSAFKEIPGGQILGPTPDYTHRLLDFEQIDETPEAFRSILENWMDGVALDPHIDQPAQSCGFSAFARISGGLRPVRGHSLRHHPTADCLSDAAFRGVDDSGAGASRFVAGAGVLEYARLWQRPSDRR